MGITVLRDVLAEYRTYEMDGVIYLPVGVDPSLDAAATVLSYDPAINRRIEGLEGFLLIEQVRDIVEGLEAQLSRVTTPSERLRAVIHYALHDAYIDPSAAIDD